MVKTWARQRSKFGGRLEDIEVPLYGFSNCTDLGGERVKFISKFPRMPKCIKERYSMIAIPDEVMELLQKGLV